MESIIEKLWSMILVPQFGGIALVCLFLFLDRAKIQRGLMINAKFQAEHMHSMGVPKFGADASLGWKIFRGFLLYCLKLCFALLLGLFVWGAFLRFMGWETAA